MENSTSAENAKTADGTRPGNPQPLKGPAKVRLKKWKYLGVLLYLKETQQLPGPAVEWLAWSLAKLKLSELQLASNLALELMVSSERQRARLGVNTIRISSSGLKPSTVKLRELNRIGVGYRDKGSLRPEHSPTMPVNNVHLEGPDGILLPYQVWWTCRLRGLVLPQEEVLRRLADGGFPPYLWVQFASKNGSTVFQDQPGPQRATEKSTLSVPRKRSLSNQRKRARTVQQWLSHDELNPPSVIQIQAEIQSRNDS